MDIVTDNVTRAQQKQSENWQHCASTQSYCVTVPDVLKVFINGFSMRLEKNWSILQLQSL